MDEFVFADPGSFVGQLERGRGAAVHRIAAVTNAAEVVYRCVVEDSRWDRQTEERDSYLADWIVRLGLPVVPLEQHLYTAKDAEDTWLALAVLGQLPFAGRGDAVELLRRYALNGRFWSDAVDTIGWSGSWKLPGVLDGLADGVVGDHDDAELAKAVGACEPWLSFARSQPRIAELVNARTARRPVTGPTGAIDVRYDADTLVERVYASNGVSRRDALLELGNRGDLRLLDLAADVRLRNAAGWTPGMPAALERLGAAAVETARHWVESDDPTLIDLGAGVLSAHGQLQDGPVLLAAVQQAVDDHAWCAVEMPARGLGRLRYPDATDVLRYVWDVTIHSASRHALLDGLAGCAPDVAIQLATTEALDDCEHTVQRAASALIPERRLRPTER